MIGGAKIMPLGDSITVGYPDVDGYRKSLHLDLFAAGFNVEFVGSQKNGTGFDIDNEGHLGYYANQIRDNVYGYLESNPADVVLLHIGTNDIVDEQEVSGIVDEVSGILDRINKWESDKNKIVTVVLARIILNMNSSDLTSKTIAYNNALETMASARIASGDQIIVVNMADALNYPADLVDVDGIHPNPVGYEKMADAWYTELIRVLGFSLTINKIGNGVITPSVAQSFYPYGAVVNLSASPAPENPGQRNSWLGWTGSGSGSYSGTNNEITITMNGPITQSAQWSTEYKLSITTNAGSTQLPAGEYWYQPGTPVTVEAISPSAGTGAQYTFLGWIGTGSAPVSGSSSTASFTIQNPSSITWMWDAKYYLTVTSQYGSVNGAGWYDAGASAYASVSPTSVTQNGVQYVFSGWSGDASGGGSSSNAITMDNPKTATANWSATTPTPTPTAKPTPAPTPTIKPTPSPTIKPTISPTPIPTAEPSATSSTPPIEGDRNLFLYLGLGVVAVGVISVGGMVFYKKKTKSTA